MVSLANHNLTAHASIWIKKRLGFTRLYVVKTKMLPMRFLEYDMRIRFSSRASLQACGGPNAGPDRAELATVVGFLFSRIRPFSMSVATIFGHGHVPLYVNLDKSGTFGAVGA